MDAVERHPQRFVDAYRRRFGHVFNADNGSELFEEYAASPDTRATRVAAVRSAAARVVDLAYEQRLSEPVRAGRLPLVVFMSGGNGSGKSSSVPPDGPEHIVFDSTLSQYALSAARIQEALDAGFDVDVRHLSRDPEDAWAGVLHRAMHEGQGRTVTLSGHMATHAGARATLVQLLDRFRSNPRVHLLVWENGRAGLRRRALDWLHTRDYPDGDVLAAALRARLERARKTGHISDAVYRGCAGLA